MNDRPSHPLSTTPLELDSDLRLHAQRLQLGRAELLTDALTLPFNDIESRLAQFALNTSTQQAEQLRKGMKHYLGRLNSNPLIPLQFRLKVLNRFEQELDLFDADMTAAVLNSHKIAVEMVQKAARDKNSYYPILVDMLSSAMELALKLLLISLEKYQAASIIATRQFFELAKLALAVSSTLNNQFPEKNARLNSVICKFELLRLLDFYSKTGNEQKQTWKELQHHIGSLQAGLYRSGEADIPLNGDRFLVTNLNRPNNSAMVLAEVPAPLQYDCIIIPIDKLISRLSMAVEHIRSILGNPEHQKELYTEEAMTTTLIGGKAILAALAGQKRSGKRSDMPDTQALIEWDCSKALSSFASGIDHSQPGSMLNHSSPSQWLVINHNAQGACLERLSYKAMTGYVGSLIGFHCLTDDEKPRLGFVRWAKEIKTGEQRLGIAFLQGRMQLLQGMISGGSEDMDLKRSWPVLITAVNENKLTGLFPDNRIYRNMTFALIKDNKRFHYRINRIIEKGPNYSRCECVRAKVKGKSET
ncbi:hypothetical protein MMIC_P1347 [Mariprofundus micogutta]|uniref:Uncharacterized protein n=1 Tax=Mariprofundus micogutta TaxID=1921010 RepID=A0A1L8CN83_9PROT|nr:hypothetical protein [Mariprofundus micogutta]GAV20382.1 hypothetical protein MMIC_P1347 [Mariprofundus micogutta]